MLVVTNELLKKPLLLAHKGAINIKQLPQPVVDFEYVNYPLINRIPINHRNTPNMRISNIIKRPITLTFLKPMNGVNYTR